jgi:anti-sigma regulatory factor (Ser/Thr protein kinase)
VRELSLHVLDVLENSLTAGARHIRLEIDEDTRGNRLSITIEDDGCGMDAETQAKAVDPYYTTRTTRHVGLGLPLLKSAAERCEGGLDLTSQVRVGTTVVATFRRDHIDRAPLGDMVSTLMGALLSSREGWELQFRHRLDDREFRLDTAEVREILGDVPLKHPAVREWLESYLRQGYEELYDGQVA